MENNENRQNDELNEQKSEMDGEANHGLFPADEGNVSVDPDKSESAEEGNTEIPEEDVHKTESGTLKNAESASQAAKKKTWRCRSVAERLVTLIPAVIMFALLITAELQMEIGTEYTAEFVFSMLLVISAVVLGIFCVRLGKVWGWIIAALTPAASFFLTEYFTHNPFDISSKLIWTNLIFYYATALLVLFLTGSIKASVAVTAAVPMIFGIANYYVLEFRGNPLFPWDIASAGIAADVAGNYNFVVTWHVCFIVCAFIFIMLLGFLSTPRIRLKWWWLRVPVSLVSVVALVLTGSYVQSDTGVSELGMYPYLFTPKTVYNRNGAAVTFAYTLQYSGIQKPEGYSTAKLSELLSEYESEAVSDQEGLPNVIVVMNEAFSDLKTAADYKEAQPVTPYIDSLTDNTVKGTLHVSVKGGNTANTEFEFLTGLSMAHFTPGSIPYQQYLRGETPSLASQLAELGYRTIGMHPYGASGWNRDNVYEWFGFEETYFSSAFKGYEKIRDYYSDAATYKKIIELYEAKEDNERLFVFDVTMQNHSGYTKQYEDLTPEIFASGLPYSGVTNTYLTLINKSDEAFGQLVDYFAEQGEPTVILMFGDHQPNDNVVTPLWRQLGIDVETGSIEEQLLRYTVPFVMWANYDIEEETGIDISVNYLSSLLCEKAGIPRTSAQLYLSDLFKTYPVICAGHYGDAAGNYFDAIAMTEVSEINEYAMLSYNLVADRKNMLKNFFSYEN